MTAFDATFGLLVTFLGLGVVVNIVIVYAAIVAMGERDENRQSPR